MKNYIDIIYTEVRFNILIDYKQVDLNLEFHLKLDSIHSITQFRKKESFIQVLLRTDQERHYLIQHSHKNILIRRYAQLYSRLNFSK